MSASVTQHLHAPVVWHYSLSLCLWLKQLQALSLKGEHVFFVFGLIPASVLLFFYGFILIEWYFCVWCNTMKTYIINRLHHGFKEYCCFVIPLATMILRLSNGPSVNLFITFIGFFVPYNLEQKRCSSLRDFHYNHIRNLSPMNQRMKEKRRKD